MECKPRGFSQTRVFGINVSSNLLALVSTCEQPQWKGSVLESLAHCATCCLTTVPQEHFYLSLSNMGAGIMHPHTGPPAQGQLKHHCRVRYASARPSLPFSHASVSLSGPRPHFWATLAVSRDTCAAYCCVSPAPKVDLHIQPFCCLVVCYISACIHGRRAARLIGMPSPFIITLPKKLLCELMRFSVSSTTDRSPMSVPQP